MSLFNVLIGLFVIYYIIAGYGCLVLAKDSKHVCTDRGNFSILLIWPIVLLIAALEKGK